MDPSHQTESLRSISSADCVPLKEDSLACSTWNLLMQETTASSLSIQEAVRFEEGWCECYQSDPALTTPPN